MRCPTVGSRPPFFPGSEAAKTTSRTAASGIEIFRRFAAAPEGSFNYLKSLPKKNLSKVTREIIVAAESYGLS